MTLTGDIEAERAALADSLSSAGASAHAGYQLRKLPAGVRVTVATDDDGLRSSVGPESGPAVIVRGTPASLVRWLAGRRASSEVAMTGPDTHVQVLRAFEGHV